MDRHDPHERKVEPGNGLNNLDRFTEWLRVRPLTPTLTSQYSLYSIIYLRSPQDLPAKSLAATTPHQSPMASFGPTQGPFK